MPDDVPDDGWNDPEPETEAPEVAHDDIMKRLVDYQRSLREGASPSEAAETAEHLFAERDETEAPTTTSELVDLSSAEPAFEIEPLPEPAGEIEPEPDPASESQSEPEPVTFAEDPQPEMVEAAYEPAPTGEVPPDVSAEPVPGLVAIAEQAGEMTAESRTDLEERLTALEDRLQHLGSKVGELRRNFQEMAIAADERLAAMEDEIGQVRREAGEP